MDFVMSIGSQFVYQVPHGRGPLRGCPSTVDGDDGQVPVTETERDTFDERQEPMPDGRRIRQPSPDEPGNRSSKRHVNGLHRRSREIVVDTRGKYEELTTASTCRHSRLT